MLAELSDYPIKKKRFLQQSAKTLQALAKAVSKKVFK